MRTSRKRIILMLLALLPLWLVPVLFILPHTGNYFIPWLSSAIQDQPTNLWGSFQRILAYPIGTYLLGFGYAGGPAALFASTFLVLSLLNPQSRARTSIVAGVFAFWGPIGYWILTARLGGQQLNRTFWQDTLWKAVLVGEVGCSALKAALLIALILYFVPPLEERSRAVMAQ